jgi:hypothetical protein
MACMTVLKLQIIYSDLVIGQWNSVIVQKRCTALDHVRVFPMQMSVTVVHKKDIV